MKRLNLILDILIGSLIGTFLGNGVYRFWDFTRHPDLYTMQTVSWYTSIILQGVITIIVVIILIIIKLITNKKK